MATPAPILRRSDSKTNFTAKAQTNADNSLTPHQGLQSHPRIQSRRQSNSQAHWQSADPGEDTQDTETHRERLDIAESSVRSIRGRLLSISADQELDIDLLIRLFVDLKQAEKRGDIGYLRTHSSATLDALSSSLFNFLRRFSADIEAELRKLEACDLLIFQFPIWWFGLPGILKGWVDRVFAMGRIYGHGKRYEEGRFRGRRAMLSLTTGAPDEAWTPGGLHGDIDSILRPVHRGIFQFVGYDVLRPHVCCSVARVGDNERAAMLDDWRRRAGGLFEESPMDVGRY